MIAEDPIEEDDDSAENSGDADNSDAENTADDETDAESNAEDSDGDAEDADSEDADAEKPQDGESESVDAAEVDDGTPKTYDFSHPQHRLNKPLSGLSVSTNKVAGDLAARIDLSIHVACTAKAVTTELRKHEDISNALHPSTCVFEFNTKDSGKCYVIIQPELVFALVQSFFGGSEDYEFEASERGMSTTETRLASRLRDCIIASLGTVWNEALGFSVSNKEPMALDQFSADGLESPIVATLQFELSFGSREASFSVLFPYQSLGKLTSINTISGSSPENSQWHTGLRRQLVGCELDIHGVLAETEITVNQLLKMQKGDFIPLGSVQTATFSTGNTPLFEAVIGASNGRVSASISHWLGHKESTDGAAANEHFRK